MNGPLPEENPKSKPFVVGPDNIGKVLKAVRNYTRKIDIEVAAERMEIRKCHVCEIAMLMQPAAMQFTENGPIYFCEEHVPKLFS